MKTRCSTGSFIGVEPIGIVDYTSYNASSLSITPTRFAYLEMEALQLKNEQFFENT